MSPAARRSPTPTRPTDGSDGPEVRFHERLLPGPATWVVVVVLGGAFGVVMVPLSLTLAVVVGAVCIALASALAVTYSPVLEVGDGRFRMGRAEIAVDLLGEPEVLDRAAWERTMGQDFEPLAHHCVRAWVRRGLRVAVLDPEDPTTAWVASTRRAEDLALALRAARRRP